MQRSCKKWKVLFVGDVYIRHPVRDIIDDEIKALVGLHDAASCNFEGPIKPPGAVPIQKAGVHICQHHDAANIVMEAGFDVVNLANNHAYDYGPEALKATMDSFSEVTLLGAGLSFDKGYELAIKKINSVSVGFLGYCEAEFGALLDKEMQGGYAWVNHRCVNKLVSDAKNRVDVLFVQVHAGVEGVDVPLPEWRQRYRELIDYGADAVIGHHPHVPQGWEEYCGKPIFYSLGNFYFDLPRKDENWNQGYVVSLTYDGELLCDYKVIPIEKVAGTVSISKDSSYKNHLDYLHGSLDKDQYTRLVDQQVLELWETRYRKYYIKALHSNYRNMAFKVLSSLTNSINIDHALLLHNIRIESHRWAVERALSLLIENQRSPV